MFTGQHFKPGVGDLRAKEPGIGLKPVPQFGLGREQFDGPNRCGNDRRCQ